MTLKKILPLVLLLAVVVPAQASAAPKSKFRFAQATYVATEGQGHIDVTVTRSARHGHSRINQTSTVKYALTGGTATLGTDYSLTPTPGTLTFAPGVTTQTIRVDITQDTQIEGLESIQLKLSAASRNSLITNPRSAQVLIADDDGPTQIALVPASQNVSEGDGTAPFYAVRSGDITGTSSVHYATSDGTAVNPDDYTAQSGDFTFASSDFVKTINVPIIDDTLIENPEDFNVTLSNVTGAVFANNAPTVTASATIVDNDSPPVFALDASSYSVNEDGSVDVTVNRLGNTAAPVAVSSTDLFTVDWTTTDGTATNPADYIPSTDNTLEFDSTDDSETITISATDATQIGLVDDTLVEGDETFGLGLANPTSTNPNAAATLGTPSSAIVTIHDNDTPGGGDNGSGGDGGNTGGGTSGGTGGGDTGNPGEQLVLGARQSACGLVVKAAKKQALLKTKALILKIRSAQPCKVGFGATVKQVKAKKKHRQAQIVRALLFKGKATSISLQPNKATTVKVKFTKKTLKAIKKALRARKQLVATVVVTERAGSAPAKKRTLKITIRR